MALQSGVASSALHAQVFALTFFHWHFFIRIFNGAAVTCGLHQISSLAETIFSMATINSA